MPVVKTSKEEIIKRSAAAFRKQGYFNTSISDLAKACGVRNALLYYYFKDKDELLEETLKYSHEYFKRKAFKYAFEDEMTPKERLTKLTDLAEKMFLGEKGGCLMAVTVLETAHFNPKFLELVRDFFEDWIKSLTHIYLNKYPKKEAHELAERTVQDIEGGIMLTLLFKKEKYLLKALVRAKTLLD